MTLNAYIHRVEESDMIWLFSRFSFLGAIDPGASLQGY